MTQQKTQLMKNKPQKAIDYLPSTHSISTYNGRVESCWENQ